MPVIHSADQVIRVENFDGVRLKIHLVPKIGMTLGILLIIVGIFQQKTEVIYPGMGVIVLTLILFYTFASTAVEVLKDGKWSRVSTFAYSKAEDIKKELSRSITT